MWEYPKKKPTFTMLCFEARLIITYGKLVFIVLNIWNTHANIDRLKRYYFLSLHHSN